jgi:hypothetical protein
MGGNSIDFAGDRGYATLASSGGGGRNPLVEPKRVL